MKTKQPINVYRITITEAELYAAMEILCETRNSVGLSTDGQTLYDKLDEHAYKVNKGTKKPAYLATGRSAGNAVSMSSLGATEEELHRSFHSAEVVEDAEMAAATDFVLTGERKQWWEFVDASSGMRSAAQYQHACIRDNPSADAELFKLL